MTREEIINKIKPILEELDCPHTVAYFTYNDREWLEENIRILEQESKTEKVIKMRDATPEERKSVDKYVKSISKPTGVDFWDLEQKPKIAHWINHEIKGTCRWLTCSLCGYEWVNKKENFCPNCGARMIEPQESEE